jgi:lysophospholipase L1-like esterase
MSWNFAGFERAGYDLGVIGSLRTGARALLFLASTASTALAASACRSAEVPVAPPLALTAQQIAVDGGAGDRAMRLVGRFDRTDPAGPRFAWSGSTVIVRFAGSELVVRLKDDGTNFFHAVVDGRGPVVFATNGTKDRYVVASGLSPGEHEVVLVKRTEAKMGEVQLLGFEPPSALLAPRGAPSRKIELIGDSITAGFGNEGASPQCSYSPATENAYESYGAIAARALGADVVNVSWAGKTIGEMTQLWERTLPARDASAWDFAWIPDAVVVNLGTNNFGWADPGLARFTEPYGKLLEKIRARYPSAHVVCMLGPMLSDTYPEGKQQLSRARAYTKAAVDAARARGDQRVHFLEVPPQDPTTAGCGFHPSVATHRKMAESLAATLRDKLGW